MESGMESGKSSKIKVESGVKWPLSTLSGFSTLKWKIFSNSEGNPFVVGGADGPFHAETETLILDSDTEIKWRKEEKYPFHSQ